MTQEKKPFWKSKTKWAGILTGLGLAIPGIVRWLNGEGFPLVEMYTAVIAILAVMGIRDLPILNQK